MTESTPPAGGPPTEDRPANDIASEFRQMGEHLKSIFQSAWESEERKKLQQEIESGLTELGNTLNQTVTDIKSGPTGQRLKADVDDFRTRLRSGEVEAQARKELLAVLRKVNSELQAAVSHKAPPGQGPGTGEG